MAKARGRWGEERVWEWQEMSLGRQKIGARLEKTRTVQRSEKKINHSSTTQNKLHLISVYIFSPSFITLLVIKVIYIQKQIILNTEKHKIETVIHCLALEKSAVTYHSS